MMHLTKNIIKIVARVVNSCYLLAERVRRFTILTQCRITGNSRAGRRCGLKGHELSMKYKAKLDFLREREGGCVVAANGKLSSWKGQYDYFL